MKSILPWAKANPITIGSGVVTLGAFILLFVVGSRGGTFQEEVRDWAKVRSRVEKLLKTPVKVPPLKPDDPEREFSITVNQAAIDDLTQVYGQMNEQYAQIHQLAVQFNKNSHEPMLYGLFPQPSDVGKRHDAKRAYLEAFATMLGPYNPDVAYPTLDAAAPPHPNEMTETVRLAEDKFLSSRIFPPKDSVNDLTQQQFVELDRFKSQKLVEMLVNYAQSIHLYADVSAKIESSDFPFDIDQWSRDGEIPSMEKIWEGQMGLWIQRDIAEVIATTNRTNDPKANVSTAPVKRLVRIELINGYVGRNGSKGGIGDTAITRSSNPSRSQGGGDGRSLSADKKIPDDFSISPTGRYSNPVYDVVHVWVTLDIDSKTIPTFFDHLRRVSLMTVLNVEMTDIDEYELLREGYYYGACDAVRIRVLIETIWLRDWVTRYMPDPVRHELGITVENDG